MIEGQIQKQHQTTQSIEDDGTKLTIHLDWVIKKKPLTTRIKELIKKILNQN